MKPFKEKFKRIETKYVLTKHQLAKCQEVFKEHLIPNEYAKSTIANLYYDTPTYALIRASIEKPNYKEKLRVRSYSAHPEKDSEVFIEVKKKFQKVVYKRRVKASLAQATHFLNAQQMDALPDSQVKSEIQWLQNRYEPLEPKMYIYYDRYAMQAKDDEELRITIDYNLRYRTTDLALECGTHGLPLMDEHNVIMEIKSASAYPKWLSELLSELHIYKSSFSKYGTAYKKTKQQGEMNYDTNII